MEGVVKCFCVQQNSQPVSPSNFCSFFRVSFGLLRLFLKVQMLQGRVKSNLRPYNAADSIISPKVGYEIRIRSVFCTVSKTCLIKQITEVVEIQNSQSSWVWVCISLNIVVFQKDQWNYNTFDGVLYLPKKRNSELLNVLNSLPTGMQKMMRNGKWRTRLKTLQLFLYFSNWYDS